MKTELVNVEWEILDSSYVDQNRSRMCSFENTVKKLPVF
jgi:hypothetical protein